VNKSFFLSLLLIRNIFATRPPRLLLHNRHLALQFNDFIFKQSILHFHTTHCLLKITYSILMFCLPFLHHFFLLSHYFICALLNMPMFFFLLQQTILNLSQFNITLVIQLIYSFMVNHF